MHTHDKYYYQTSDEIGRSYLLEYGSMNPNFRGFVAVDEGRIMAVMGVFRSRLTEDGHLYD